MIKNFIFSILILLFSVQAEAQFKATLEAEGSTLIVSLTPIGGDITTDFSIIEFFIRTNNLSSEFTMAQPIVNSSNFSGNIPIQLVNEVTAGFYRTFQFGYPQVPSGSSQVYLQDVKYELCRIDISGGFGYANFELVSNLDDFSSFLTITNGSGQDLTFTECLFFNTCSGENVFNGDLTNTITPFYHIEAVIDVSTGFIGSVIYVDKDATGEGTGENWDDAFTDLQAAIAFALPGFKILVKTGTYYAADTNGNRSSTFDIEKDITIFGGFDGTETDLSQRDIDLNPTIFSGDIDQDGTLAGNTFHTVRVKDATVLLDGLHIQDGNADNSSSFAQARGGGIYVTGSTLTLNNCRVLNNNALFGGGIFATLSPQVDLEYSTFEGNEAGNGSAIYHSNETYMNINSCQIKNNNSTIRCAVEINNSNSTNIANTVIANNTATNANGLAIISTNRDVQCNIYNSTIIGGNKNRSLLTLQIGNNDQLDVDIHNTILAHQNPNFNKSIRVYNNGVYNLFTDHCYIQGATVPGNTSNNLYEDVVGDLLYNPDYSLQACSPAVNSGNSAEVFAATDVIGNDREIGTVDIGAYESQTNCPSSKLISTETLTADDNENILLSRLYPNPSYDVLSVEFETQIAMDIQLSISDITGKMIKEYTLASNGSLQIESIDVSYLNKGLYLLSLTNKEGKATHKFEKL